MANVRKLADPAQMAPWLEFQLIGTARSVRARLERYVALGFDHFIVQNSTYGMPRAYRHEMTRRFARDVMPHFRDSARSS